eukprot:9087998-Pyramimonas_sp.AAC.1
MTSAPLEGVRGGKATAVASAAAAAASWEVPAAAANFIKARIATVFVGLDQTVDQAHVDPNVHVSISD